MRIDVRGPATPEEVAALTAILMSMIKTPAGDPVERWRESRLRARTLTLEWHGTSGTA